MGARNSVKQTPKVLRSEERRRQERVPEKSNSLKTLMTQLGIDPHTAGINA